MRKTNCTFHVPSAIAVFMSHMTNGANHTYRERKALIRGSPNLNSVLFVANQLMTNMISVSSAPITRLGNARYYDLPATLNVMRRVLQESVVDGFEFQVLPEWDSENPPLTDAEHADWRETPKYTIDEILMTVKEENLPILSVHASRDLGNYLCSDKKRDVEKGKRLIHDSLYFTESMGAEVCVFHLWNTWKERFDVNGIRTLFREVSSNFPHVKASVENIPTHLEGYTPLTLAQTFEYVTLDLRWAVLYNEFHDFGSIADKLANVHLHAKLEGERWSLEHPSLGFCEALDIIKYRWRYPGLLTVEPRTPENFDEFIRALTSLRT